MTTETILIFLTILLIVGIGALLLLREIRTLKEKTSTTSLLQEQLLEIIRQIGDMRDQQTQGQVRHLETVQNQFATIVGTFNTQLGELTAQLNQGQGETLKSLNQRLEDTTRTLNDQLGRLLQTMNEQLTKTQGNIGQQLQGATEVISKVQLRLGELFETAKHMQELGKDISRLQDILKAPKLRGGIGEYLLENLLAQILPQRNYEVQYAFKSGEKVDVLIRLGSNTVPVDAKFPLESFERLRQAETEAERKKAKGEFMTSVKARIDEIARKYIKPEEGTYDFALMYIPAENVFYEVIVKDEQLGEEKSIASYALERHVVPVSPNSFYAYLMAIAFGLRGFHIEKQAQEIRGSIGELQKLFGIFYEQFTAVGRNIDLAQRKYEEARKRAEKIHDQMAGITGQALHLEGEGALPSSVDKKEG